MSLAHWDGWADGIWEGWVEDAAAEVALPSRPHRRQLEALLLKQRMMRAADEDDMLVVITALAPALGVQHGRP